MTKQSGGFEGTIHSVSRRPTAWRVASAVAVVAVVVLQFVAIHRQSLIGDAPYHLLAGDQALRYGQNRLNLEHPPLVKLAAALALLPGEPLSPPVTVDRAIETSRLLFDDPARMNSVRYGARGILLVLFAFPLLASCFGLGRLLGGPTAGWVLSLSLGLSFQVIPYLAVIQTDTAVSLGFVLSVVSALSYIDRPRLANIFGMGLGVGLAIASKFSGTLVVPVVFLAIVFAHNRSWRHRLLDLGCGVLLAMSLVYSIYALANRDYDPSVGRDTIRRYCHGQAMLVEDRMAPYEDDLLTVESRAPNLAQWLTGFLGIRIQNQIGVYASYAFGEIRSQGRWWYFPVLFLVKTPIVLLAATVLALVAWYRRPFRASFCRRRAALIGLTVALYGGVAVTSSYNLGVRHLMPLIPFLYLPAALWAAKTRLRSLAVVGALVLEASFVAPLWMSATNTWWLGRDNPTRFSLSAGNSEYRQNFIVLSLEADRRGIDRLHVLYPLVTENEIHAYLPHAVVMHPGKALEAGWYAVNLQVEQYIPALLRASEDEVYQYRSLVALAKAWEPYWQEVAGGEDHGYIAGTFHLYRLPGT